jgi:hypothetical protein
MEFKELFALQPGAPIISLGDMVAYQTFIIHADAPINKAQQQYNVAVVDKKEPNGEKGEPKRALTKGEQARERKQQRLLERQQRREQYRRDRDAEIERDREGADRERGGEAAHRQEVRQNAVAGLQAAARLPVQIRAVPVAPVVPARQDLDNPAVKADVDGIDPGTRRVMFWAVIARLNWHNASDGAMPAGPVGALFNGLSARDALIFKREYENMFNGAIEFLRADGMFDRNGAVEYRAQAKIVSHIIALGEDQYTTLISDPMILQFLIEAGECQSLNDLLPENIKV